MTAPHTVDIRPPRRANDPLDWLAQCKTCGRYRRGWQTDVKQWAATHRTHSIKVEGECSLCEGEGHVAKNFGLNGTDWPAITPCPQCGGEG